MCSVGTNRQMTRKQQTLAMAADQGEEFEQYRKPTKRDAFLATMDQIVLWWALCEAIEPHYPQGRQRTPAHWARAHAADVLRAALVQPCR